MALDSLHGTRQRYRSGCGCPECRKANSDDALARRDHSPKARRKRAEAVLRFYHRNRDAQLKARRAYRATPRGKAEKLRHRKSYKNGALTELGAEYAVVLFNDPCAYCGAPVEEIDHIHSVARGGTGEMMNLTSACRVCNARKYTKSLLHFLLER